MLTGQQKLASFLQSELFLVSQGLRPVMDRKPAIQACAAHAAGIAQRVDAKLGDVVIADPAGHFITPEASGLTGIDGPPEPKKPA